MRKTALVLVLLLLQVALAATAGAQSAPTPFHYTALRIGTWNVMLQPWLPYEDRVLPVLETTNFDVLVLEEVWTEEARDRILAAVATIYPYFYWSPAVQQPASCDLSGFRTVQRSPGGITPNVSSPSVDDYISCLTSTGTDTRTVEQPIAPVDPLCQFLGLNIALEDQGCFECLQSTMQDLPASASPFGARTLCAQANGVKLAHRGNVGRLVLSKSPITNVQDVPFIAYSFRRVNTYATIMGVRLAFVHWPPNYLFDVDPSLGPLQTGALQPDLASDVLTHAPRIIVGGFNSGPDYQPDGYNQLLQSGYRSVFTNQPTYCTPALQNFPPCADFNATPTSIDNILLQQNAGTCQKMTFGEQEASDHIGLAALCIVKTP